eukprot:PhF_6_TR10367/c0_g2_i1/m.16102
MGGGCLIVTGDNSTSFREMLDTVLPSESYGGFVRIESSLFEYCVSRGLAMSAIVAVMYMRHVDITSSTFRHGISHNSACVLIQRIGNGTYSTTPVTSYVVRVSNVFVYNCSAATNGGGLSIYLNDNFWDQILGTIEILGVTVVNTSTGDMGGGIEVLDTKRNVVLRDVTVRNCSAAYA